MTVSKKLIIDIPSVIYILLFSICIIATKFGNEENKISSAYNIVIIITQKTKKVNYKKSGT